MVDEALLLDAVRAAVSSGDVILRARCAELEAALAREHGVAHGVATASPTAALLLALTALELGDGGVALGEGAPPFATGVAERAGARIDGGAPTSIAAAGAGAFRVAGPAGAILVLDLGPASPAGGVAEAAMLLCDDPALATSLRMLRNHGQDGRTRFLHHVVGFNARMDEIAAAYLLARGSAER